MKVRKDVSTAKGRAELARPSLCVLIVALVMLSIASAAQAAPPVPVLTGTSPISPGASVTPRILGQISGGETKVVHFGVASALGGPLVRSLELGNTVKLYTDAGCSGPVVGKGTVEELVGNEGVALDAPVALESVTTYFATQGNGGGTSECSPQGVTYRQVNTAPGPPSFASVNPASPANDNFPRLFGSADPEATVSIYTDSNCTDPATWSGSGAAFAASGIQVAVPDNSQTTFYAKATMAGFSACSTSSIPYSEVTPAVVPGPGGEGGSSGTSAPPGSPPPAPHLRTIPGGSANDNTPLVSGTAPRATTVRIFASADCSGPVVAKNPASQFADPGLAVQVVDNVAVVFSAVSASAGGQSDCSPPVLYVEDSLTPHTRITMGPAAKTAKRKAIFRFVDTTGDAPGTAFLCKIDKRQWKRCSSPLRMKGLRSKLYLIQVKAIDPAGNVERKAAKRKFRVVPRP